MNGPVSEYRVSVVAVGDAASAHAAALAWTGVEGPWLSCNKPDESQRDVLGKKAALVWWSETDQCSDCDVTLRFEGEHFGRKVEFTRRVALTIETVARVVPVDAQDGRRDAVGVAPTGEQESRSPEAGSLRHESRVRA